jgi:hypothetical protein
MQVIIRHEIFLIGPQFTQKLAEKVVIGFLPSAAASGNRGWGKGWCQEKL